MENALRRQELEQGEQLGLSEGPLGVRRAFEVANDKTWLVWLGREESRMGVSLNGWELVF